MAAVGTAQAAAVACPKVAREDNESLKNNKRYFQRGAKGQCDKPFGVWRWDTSSEVRCKYERVAELLRLGPGHQVLEFGAGCGHALDLIAGQRGFSAVGLDIVPEVGRWAKEHLTHLADFCVMDGSDLSFIGDGTVDAVLSNAALYHVPRPAQCKFVHELLRVLRVGGCSWHGWLGTEPSHQGDSLVFAEFWTQECLAGVPGVVAATMDELSAFGVTEYWKHTSRNRSFSLVFCKTGKTGKP